MRSGVSIEARREHGACVRRSGGGRMGRTRGMIGELRSGWSSWKSQTAGRRAQGRTERTRPSKREDIQGQYSPHGINKRECRRRRVGPRGSQGAREEEELGRTWTVPAWDSG